jgi:ATP-dependent exoDNAse (exonuclease V) alpha subunit
MKAKCLTSFNKYKYLIIDEKSMVNEVYWSLLYKIKNQCPDLHIIVCGDWLQLLPVNDRYEGADCENSRMLYDMCDGIMLKLSKCRRSDKKLFDLYMDPRTVNVDDFPHEMQSRAICYTNRMRKIINAEWMEHFKKEKVVILELEAFKEDAKKMSQNMSVFKGLPVMATRTMEKYQIYNADEYVVEAIYKRKSSLILKREVGEEYERIEIKIEDFRQSFVPAYAITSHRSQGASFDMPYSIYEWEKMSDRMKYVALSRARKLDLIHIMQ